MNSAQAKIYAYTSGSGWIDLTSDVISSIDIKYGIRGLSYNDRVSDVGTIEFILNNTTGSYTPNNEYDFGKGTYIYLTVEDTTLVKKYKFYGKIEELQINNDLDDIPIVEITAVDTINEVSNTPLPAYPIDFNVSYYFGIDSMLDEVTTGSDFGGWRNYNTNIGTVFPTVFDSEGDTNAYSEVNNFARSEIGYIYLRHNIFGSEIVIEPAGARVGQTETEYPQDDSFSGRLLSEGDSNIVQEDGSYILLDQLTSTCIVNQVLEYELSYGDNLINHLTIQTNPRKIDSASSVLFNLDEPIYFPRVGSGSSTQIYKISYKDPNGTDEKVAGKDMIAPVSGLDFVANQWDSGSGLPMTTSFSASVVDVDGNLADFGAYEAFYKIANTSATMDGYLNLLTARGTAVYIYNPVDIVVTDSSSISKYGVMEEKIDMTYVSDPTIGRAISTTIINKEKNPRKILKSITFLANTSPQLMLAYLYNDIRDIVFIQIDNAGIAGYYLIHNIEAEILPSGIIYVTWGLVWHDPSTVS